MSTPDQTDREAERAALEVRLGEQPDDADRQYRLAVLSTELGRNDDAVRGFAAAARLRPDWAEPRFGLGQALQRAGQDEAAVTAFRSALAIAPAHAETHFALARLLDRRGRTKDALDHYNAAALYRSDWPEPHLYKGALLEGRGEVAAARQAYDRALALGAPPGFRLRRDLQVPAVASSAEAYAAARQTYAERLERLREDPPPIVDPIREAGGNRFFLAYHGLDDRPLQEGLAELFRRGCPSLTWTAPHCREPRPPRSPRRLAFVSRFFQDHSIGRLMVGLLTDLARRDDCEILVFHAAAPRDDALRREIERLADATAVLPGDLGQARETIARAAPDVLFYPDIGMDPVTYFLAFARLAPVQCATWGHPVTTGLPTIDYYLSCDAAEPDGAGTHYTERLVRVGGLPFSYRRPPRPEPLKTRADFRLGAEETIYFLAQNLFKIHPDMDEPLAGILRRDPRGIILMLEGQDSSWGRAIRDRLRPRLGIDEERVVFLPRQSHDDYMRLLALSDVSLDSFPFSGGNTTYQALAMGTPVVTLPGNFLRGRLSLAIYRHLEITDCVAADPADYAQIAVRLGTDKAFRKRVADRIEAGATRIFDDPVFLAEAGDFLLGVRPPP